MSLRPALYCGAAALLLLGALVVLQRNQITDARREAQELKGEAYTAKRVQAEATAQAAADREQADAWKREVARLKAAQAALPPDPGPRPVDPSTPAPLALVELAGLGLHPVALEAPLAAGLTLPDTHTTLHWGREAQRVGPLAARLETATALARAQEGATGALLQQVAHLTTALGAADDRATAQEGRADALERADRLRGPERMWSLGPLVGLDPDGRRHFGALATWSWKPIQAQVLYINRTAAFGAGFRF